MTKSKTKYSNQNNTSAEEDNEDEEYVVERIVDKKTEKGKTFYLLKWKGYEEDQNTWEPETNLGCPALIAEFEAKLKAKHAATSASAKWSKPEESVSKKKRSDSTKNGSSSGIVNQDMIESNEVSMNRGFERGLIPDRIIGATDASGELMFLMKWKNTDEADLVLAKTANAKCPQVVIQFYEERLTWHTSASNDNDKENNENGSSSSHRNNMLSVDLNKAD